MGTARLSSRPLGAWPGRSVPRPAVYPPLACWEGSLDRIRASLSTRVIPYIRWALIPRTPQEWAPTAPGLPESVLRFECVGDSYVSPVAEFLATLRLSS